MQYELHLAPKVRKALEKHNPKWNVWMYPRLGTDPRHFLWVKIDPDERRLTEKQKKKIKSQARRVIKKAMGRTVSKEFEKCYTINVEERNWWKPPENN